MHAKKTENTLPVLIYLPDWRPPAEQRPNKSYLTFGLKKETNKMMRLRQKTKEFH